MKKRLLVLTVALLLFATPASASIPIVSNTPEPHGVSAEAPEPPVTDYVAALKARITELEAERDGYFDNLSAQSDYSTELEAALEEANVRLEQAGLERVDLPPSPNEPPTDD